MPKMKEISDVLKWGKYFYLIDGRNVSYPSSFIETAQYCINRISLGAGRDPELMMNTLNIVKNDPL